jgi:drug/metabolite transporter (DMT)-like permease
MRRPQWAADVALASIALLWGSTFVIVKNALDEVSPILYLALRFAVASAVLFPLALRHGPIRPADWPAGLFTGLALFAGYALQTVGLQWTSPGKSGFLTGLYILFVPVLSAVGYRKPPLRSEWLAIALGLTGMWLLTGAGRSFSFGAGDLLTIGCAFAYAVHILLLGRYAPTQPPVRLASLQLVVCAVAAGASFWWLEQPYLRWSPSVLVAVLVTGILATAVAFLLQTWAQRHTTATRAAILFSLEPLFALLVSWLVGAERLTTPMLAGAGLILLSILLAELKPCERAQASRRGLEVEHHARTHSS